MLCRERLPGIRNRFRIPAACSERLLDRYVISTTHPPVPKSRPWNSEPVLNSRRMLPGERLAIQKTIGKSIAACPFCHVQFQSTFGFLLDAVSTSHQSTFTQSVQSRVTFLICPSSLSIPQEAVSVRKGLDARAVSPPLQVEPKTCETFEP